MLKEKIRDIERKEERVILTYKEYSDINKEGEKDILEDYRVFWDHENPDYYTCIRR